MALPRHMAGARFGVLVTRAPASVELVGEGGDYEACVRAAWAASSEVRSDEAVMSVLLVRLGSGEVIRSIPVLSRIRWRLPAANAGAVA